MREGGRQRRRERETKKGRGREGKATHTHTPLTNPSPPRAHSTVLPTPEMNPPSGLPEGCASAPAPMLMGGGFTLVFFSPDIASSAMAEYG